MNKRMNHKMMICLGLGLVMLTGCNQRGNIQKVMVLEDKSEVSTAKYTKEELDKILTGKWCTRLEEGEKLSLTYDGKNESLAATSSDWEFSDRTINHFKLEDRKLIFSLPYKSGYMEYELHIDEESDKKLLGTYQNIIGEISVTKPTQICFEKISDESKIGEFYTLEGNKGFDQRQKLLIDYAQYQEDDMDYTFSYDVGKKTRDEDFIKTYGLDELTDGKEDVELMKTLLYWVCKECNHGNPEGFPEERDPAHMMAFAKEKGCMNCRALSLLLAGTLRMYGIEARHITCLPESSIFMDCHVVVEAYSKEKKQWIMLDPTYNLMLYDEEGNSVNVQSLRKAIIEERELVPNKEAAYNEGGFEIKQYRNYMAKNCFRFTSAQKLYPGAEIGLNENVGIELVPVGYEEAFDGKNYVITTDEERFFAAPNK